MKEKMQKLTPKKWLCIALVLILISSIGASLVQSVGGRVTVKEMYWETESGHRMSAYLFVPDNATADNPAPAIVCSHGWYNNREMQDLNYVEYARRGFVVMSIDMYGHGNSDVIEINTWWNDENNANGMYDAVKLLDKLPYVDSARIGVTGHSNGGRASRTAMALDNEAETRLIAAGLIVSNDVIYSDSPTASYIYDNTGEWVNLYGSRDVGIVACQYDEFFHRVIGPDNTNPAYSAPRDYMDQVTSQSFLHFGTDPSGKEHRDSYTIYKENIDGEEAIRVIYNPGQIHPWAHFSANVVESSIEFFDAAFGAPNPIASNNQIWQWKVFFNAVGLVAFVLFFINIIKVLVETKFFSAAKVSDSAELGPAPDKTGKIWLWGTLIASTIFSMVFYYTSKTWTDGIFAGQTFFNQPATFYIGIWTLACGLFSILMMVLSYQLNGKKNGVNLRAQGVILEKGKLLKTILLALTAAALTYSLVFVTQWLFQVDFRIWVLTIKAFSADKITTILRFLPFWLIYYVANSVAINSFNYVQIGKKKSEFANTAVMMLFNALPSAILIIWIYGTFASTGYLPHETLVASFPGIGGSIIGIWQFPIVIILPVAALISRKIYRVTKNPYIAGIATALVVVTFTCTNTLTYAF